MENPINTFITSEVEDEEFICDKCGSKFKDMNGITKHVEQCMGSDIDLNKLIEKPLLYQAKASYRCETCDKAFRSLTTLKFHMMLHSNKRPFSCNICGNSFVQKSCLKTHMKKIHAENKICKCKECGEEFTSAYRLDTHVRTFHGKDDKPFRCDICVSLNKKVSSFRDKDQLKTHMRKHSEERPFGCEECGKRFKQWSHLKTHKRLHTGEMPFPCRYCDERFRQVSNRIHHEQLVHNK